MVQEVKNPQGVQGDDAGACLGVDGDSGGASADHTAAREGSIGRIAKLTSSTKYRNIVRDIDQLLLQEEVRGSGWIQWWVCVGVWVCVFCV